MTVSPIYLRILSNVRCNLTKEHGFFSYIVSNKFVRAGYGDKLRRFMPAQGVIHQFLDLETCQYFRAQPFIHVSS